MIKRVDNKILTQIYRLMFNKLREIQVGNRFNKLIEERRRRTYRGKRNDWFFAQMVPCIFGSNLKGDIVQKKMNAIRKAFSNFKIDKVANYSEEDFNRLMKNKAIIRNSKKIKACMDNAKKIMKIAEEYGSFEEYVDHFIGDDDVEGLRRDVRERFSYVGKVLAYDCLNQWGIDCLKPSRDTVRIFNRLGLIDIEEDTYPDQRTREKIQNIGKEMAYAVSERLAVIDAVIWLYSSGVTYYVEKAMCTHRNRKPLCKECELYRANICKWRQHTETV